MYTRSLRDALPVSARWLRRSGRSRARVQLTRGEGAASVGRSLGYAHPPAFTRAFRDVYGAPPRDVVRKAPGDNRH